jgi:hypothetical protein
MTKIISFFITLIILFEALPASFQPSLTVDASDILGESTTRATGFLYGLAEPEVPSSAITNALKISSVSQKVPDGLQHPTGDIDHIKGQLDSCDYIVAYLQDNFDTWYYCHEEIMDMRAAGTYDWKEFLYERYLPVVEEKVKHLEAQDYSDRVVYCIFNECDNAIWFGNYIDGNVYYDDIGRQNFYEAWKITYDFIKDMAPDAKIGGPGFCDYETSKITGFMQYTAENNCVPEIMIWHELAYWSIPDWHLHYEDYRRIEKEYGIAELPIIVTEYGEPEECGNPAAMLHYIIAMEKTGIWGNMAYWRLSNNLNDTTADDNSPNSNWWLYRRYAEMKGQQRLAVSSKLQNEYEPKNRLDGLATLGDNGDSISMIITGNDKSFNVKVKNLSDTALAEDVTVRIETVYYEGLSGIVSAPTVLRQYNTKVTSDKLNITIPATDKDAVYFVTVSPKDENAQTIRNTNIPKRYEFENGKLKGDAYTYDSWYATTGEIQGMVGGMEKDGDGVKLNFTISKGGLYDLDIIFGKHNDSGIPQERDYAKVKMIIDGKEEIISLENTIKSESTTKYTVTKNLSVGIHTIELYNCEGTYVLDSMLVSPFETPCEISVLKDGNNKYFAVAPSDGYYEIYTDHSGEISIDGAIGSVQKGDIVYLRRGVNEITFGGELRLFSVTAKSFTKTIKAEDMTLSDKAELLTDKYGVTYIDNISNLGGKAQFNVNVPADGDYRLTVLYANNSEGGVHDYNVDLIERYMTVTVGDESKDVFTRNTCSKYTYKTMTFNLTLREGDNTITITNSGNYNFNNMESFAPQIAEITINALT